MTIVTIDNPKEGSTPAATAATAAEKAAIIRGVSQVFLDVLNNPLASTYAVINEVDTDDWGLGRTANARIPAS